MTASARRPFGARLNLRLLALLLILPLAFVAARSATHSKPVDQARAVAIARAHIGYTPDGENVRFIRQGVPSNGYWAVSLWQRKPNGDRTNVTVVVISADSGKITQLDRNVSP